MSRPKFPVFLCIVFSLLVVNSAQSAQKRSASKKPAPPPPVQQEVPPPPPPTPEQMPAVAPQVSYQNGQLTILARNSTLSDILRAVRTKTGADVDFPGGANERVVGQFGPGESRDVVASLLNGSHFNYVMMASETNPNQLKTLIVTSKAGNAPEVAQGAPNQPPQPEPPQVQAQEQPDQTSEDFVDDSADQDQQIADQPIQDEQQPQPQVNISPNGQVQPNVKTPEQLLQELQQRQQQIQQQQQQGGAPPPQGAPQGFPIPPQGSGPN